VENAAEVHYPEMIKSRLCITSKGGYFVFGGGMMKAKTPCENDPNSLSV